MSPFWGEGTSRSPPFQGGTSRSPPFGESRTPPWGVMSPQVPLRLPEKGTWENVPPGVPSSRGREGRVPHDPHPGGRVPLEHCISP
jgi:hypothetical protein